MAMRVEFFKVDEGRCCTWVATPPRRRPFQGTTMAAGRTLPHDLAQFVVERALGLHEGFWGLLANGASFRSVPGRRVTRPGRALARAHHDALWEVEAIVNRHVGAWRAGAETPLTAALDAAYARWLALPPGEPLVLEWPVQHLPSPPRAHRDAPRRGRGPRAHGHA